MISREIDNPEMLPCPWISGETFLEQNKDAIEGLVDGIREVFPEEGAEHVAFDTEGQPTPEAMSWMWVKLMGHQHGSQEGFGGKLPLQREQEYHFWPQVAELAYGPYSFVHATPVDPDQHYNKAFILGGYPQENISRTLAVLGYDRKNTNIDEIIMMGGQRLRWNIPGERSTSDLYDYIGRYTGTSIAELQKKSPFVQSEEQKTGPSEWDIPFATEYTMARLGTEALFEELIDWEHYDDVVKTTYDEAAQPQRYFGSTGASEEVPARTEVATSYHLNDGKIVRVLNGIAVARPQGVPRPTSDSQTREAVEIFDFGPHESIVFSSNVPHVRAAVDSLIRVIALKRDSIARADIVTAPWLPEKELLAALGEIPATYKADKRLRAVIEHRDPDAYELTSL